MSEFGKPCALRDLRRAAAMSGAPDPLALRKELKFFLEKVSDLRKAVAEVAAAVSVSDGGTGAAPAPAAPVWDSDIDMLRKIMPGTLLVLKDGSYAVVPITRAIHR
jgi:hypothetical protein